MKKFTKPALVFAIAVLTSVVGHAEEGGDLQATGVSTEAIQLPKPAGTIQGLGSEASSVGNTGAATYSVPIELPKGRNGLQPSLTLTYNSGSGEGPFGIGWSLDIPKVERSALRGVPQYLNSDLLSTSSDGELVNLGDNQYRPLIDKSQSLYVFDVSSDAWSRYEGNGLVHTFGAVSSAKVQTWAGTFQWLITSTADSFGNRIDYTYLQDQGQSYVSQIRYADLYTVYFAYAQRPDPLKAYQSTQGITTGLRCTDIWVRANQLIRHFQLSYDETPNGHLSRLRKVHLLGRDDLTAYPDLSFNYSEEPSLTTQKSKRITFDTTGVEALPPTVGNPRVTLMDINSDGIPDVIETREDGAAVWIGNGDGTFRPSYKLPQLRAVLGQKNSKFFDVNGDRQVDFVGSGLFPKYWPGDGNGSFGAPVDITSFPRYSLGSSQVRTIDVNGDGKMDLVAQEADQIWIFFNEGNGRWDRRVKLSYGDPGTPYPVFNFSSPHTFFADMNGDGLVDIVYVDLNKIYYYPNRGNGYWDTPVAMNFDGVDYQNGCLSPGNCPNPAPILALAQKERNVFLTDINGDGLADLVVVLPNSIVYAYNRGDGTFSQTYTYNNVHETPIDQQGIHVTLADMNGNGTQDIVWSNDFGDYRYFDFAELAKPNLLIEVRNGLGKSTVLEYQPHTKYGTSPLLPADQQSKIPFVAHTVKDIKVYSWGQLASETQFRYYGGYYDGSKNEFRGFRLIERYEPGDDSVPDMIDRRYFEVGKTPDVDKVRGLMLAQETRKAHIRRDSDYWSLFAEGPILSGESNQYQTLLIGQGIYGATAGLALESLKTHIEGDETGATRSFDTLTTYTLNQGAISTKSVLTKDDRGNPYRLIKDTFAHGIVLNGVSPVLWNVTNLAERDISDPSGTSGKTLQSTQFYFDGSSTLGQVTQGKITRQDKLQGAAYVTKNRYGWTVDGNLAYFEDAAGHRTRIDYEPRYRLFPTKVTNPAGHVQLASYDWDRGVISSTTDVNGNLTFYFYDPFLRLSKLIGPTKDASTIDPTHPTLEVDYIFGNEANTPSTILTKKLTDIGELTTVDSKAYFDPLGRSLGTVLSGPPGKFVHSGGAAYNIRGKVKKKFLPFFVTSLDDSSLNLTRPFIQTSFDILDRPVRIFNPESTPSNPSVKTSVYRVGQTIVTDEIGKVATNRTDFLGRLNAVIDAKNRETDYGYTVTNQLAQIIDAKGSKTIFEYDTLDRRTCKLDPNLGKATYLYNDLDLLTQKSDFGFEMGVTNCAQPNLNVPRISNYTYNDLLNRITQTSFSDGITGALSYGYDQGLNGIGKLTSTAFPIGSKALSYDVYGNLDTTNYVIDGQSFSVSEKHDVQGRIREVDYPAVNKQVLRVGYAFDEAGNLSRVFNRDTNQDYAKNLTYNELNQIHSMMFGNGIQTRMNYDVVQGSYRLTDILTYSGGAAIGDTTPVGQACSTLGASAIQCLSYQYNKTSDILQINDLSTGGVNRQFGYDDLHQLTSATGPWGVQGFTYDEIGNITSKASARIPKTGFSSLDQMALWMAASVPGISASQAYSYDPTRPQILTGVGTDSYQFDPYGNLNKRNNQSFQFDSLNHLASFSGAVQERYFYDDGGDRLEKKSPTENDFFASRYFEKRGSATFRYVFAGAKRLAVVPDNGTSTEYIHGDHLGSSNAVTDATGAVTLHREFAPYGEVVAQNGSYASLNFGFTDKYQDQETGTTHFDGREYCTGFGFWLSADPRYSDEPKDLIRKSFSPTSVYPGQFKFSGRVSARSDEVVRRDRPNLYNRLSETTVEGSGDGLPGYLATGLYSYAQNNPIKFSDPDGFRVDWNGAVISNPKVVAAVQKMNDNLISQNSVKNISKPDNFTLLITGGDRYIGDDGKVHSSQSHEVLTGRGEQNNLSRHITSKGGLAVDFAVISDRGSTQISPSDVESAAKSAGFDEQKGGEYLPDSAYPDKPHVHGALPREGNMSVIGAPNAVPGGASGPTQ